MSIKPECTVPYMRDEPLNDRFMGIPPSVPYMRRDEPPWVCMMGRIISVPYMRRMNRVDLKIHHYTTVSTCVGMNRHYNDGKDYTNLFPTCVGMNR